MRTPMVKTPEFLILSRVEGLARHPGQNGGKKIPIAHEDLLIDLVTGE